MKFERDVLLVCILVMVSVVFLCGFVVVVVVVVVVDVGDRVCIVGIGVLVVVVFVKVGSGVCVLFWILDCFLLVLRWVGIMEL